jgi:hypothetical protein
MVPGMQPRRRALLIAATLVVALCSVAPAQAADFTVTSLNDSGAGTLRQAVLDANATPAADRILFAPSVTGTITLASHISIQRPLEIIGPGPDKLAVSGDDLIKPLGASMVVPGDPVAISGLTVTRGLGLEGGAIRNQDAAMTLTNMAIVANNAGVGGGISSSGPLTLSDSTVSGNTGDSGAGGIAADTDLTILRSTIAGNVADMGGSGGGVSGPGAAGSTFTLRDSTVAGNTAQSDGGGVVNDTATLTIENSVLADNTAPNGPDLATTGGTTVAFSLVENAAGAVFAETGPNIIGQDPQLGPLANNGGSTQTMALPPTSPAVDQGASPFTEDQRGLPRPIDFPAFPNPASAGANGADIGAFELQPAAGPFKFGKLTRNKRKGRAVQAIELPIPAAGIVTLAGKNLKPKTAEATASGALKLKVVPRGKLRKKLRRKGKARVTEKVTYTPAGGAAIVQTRKVKLVKRR